MANYNGYQPFDPSLQFTGNQNNQYGNQNYNQQMNQQNFQNQGNFNTQPQSIPMNNQFRFNPNIIPGRLVENVDVLKTMEIPFDGNKYYFPKADGSEIYVKRWLENGSTEIVSYVRKTEDEQKQEDNFYADKLNTIEEMLKQIQSNMRPNNYKPNYNKPRPNKEVQQ